ncbi:N-acetylmuramoyl-L-alanine amidase [Bacillus sp. FJAT-50079]|uniref:N-acetylmuramoyl-L-alanine amidase n=1 Tax=Bacillus sp. FJAT-50079 TaxID=2833577 RepID=UPI001BC9A42E|nr:N-acetylmuramoyl-L-alanine amidase [Bacillus sp. FJAT-50079]MBS4207482.1 N-acetylmuramoyl-L-alanine amidase [Bacillus sp. FJAT-50079]
MTKGNTLSIFLFGIIFLLYFSSYEEAYASDTYKIGASSLNVRTEPSIYADVIASLPRGTTVHVSEIKYDWAKIEFSGQTGWIAAYYLYQESGQAAVQPISTSTEVTVNANGVRLRSGPSTEFTIIGYATYGETFQLIETAGQWQHIRMKNGKSAWIAGWLVSNSASSTLLSASPHSTKSVNNSGSLAGQTIIIDAGHGGYDPGAIGIGGILEKTLTLSMAHLLTEKLRNAGADVIMTRTRDRHLHVSERVNLSQSFPNSVFISIHYNAHENKGANGVKTYYYHPADRDLTTSIHQQLVAQSTLKNGGVQFGDFYVLRNNHNQSILLELGFITNQHDIQIIQTQNFQQSVAESIVQGLINYFH